MPLLTDDPTGAEALAAADAPTWRDWERAAAPAGLAAAVAALLGGPLAVRDDPRLAGRWLLWRDAAPRSQYDALQELLAQGVALPDGLACLAATGERFHGQRGRAWHALRGNLHLCVHLDLDLDATEAQAPLTVRSAVATARAIEAAGAGRPAPRTKWVNDLLWRGRKVAGVLTASHVQAGRIRHALVGIGVNVARAPQLPAGAGVAPAACLADADAAWSAPGALARLLFALLDALEQGRAAIAAGEGAALIDESRARAAFLGRRVTIWPVDDHAPRHPLARGVARALEADLSLRLDGVAAPVRAGRMTIDEDEGPLAAAGPSA